MTRFLAILAALFTLPACASAENHDRLGTIRLPPGFEIAIFAEVPRARSLAVAADLGLVFVGTRGSVIYAISYQDGAPVADSVRTLKSDLKIANGIAWRDNALYVAEQHRIIRFRGTDADSLARAAPEILFANLPDKRHHGWRYARFGPDGDLYVAVGAPCNVCSVSGFEEAIVRMAPDGGTPEIFARGVRNSVGLDFQPGTGILYFTDNGADGMGNDSPPDELNRAPEAGLHFGYPYFGGGGDRTPQFKDRNPPGPVTTPAIAFGAHVAALGVHFYRGRMLPKTFRNDAFVAQHGSWNRTVPDGYRVVRVRFGNDGQARSYEPFAEGWLRDGQAWGRPVDIAELPDGSLLVSDDRAGLIYRITFADP